MTPLVRKRRLATILSFGAALLIAVFVFVQLWSHARPRWTILAGDDAKAVVQFNHSTEDNNDPEEARKIKIWTPTSRDVAAAERQWAVAVRSQPLFAEFRRFSIGPDKLIYGYDRQYAGYFSHGRHLIMLSAHDTGIDQRMYHNDDEWWRVRATINWDEPPTRFWIEYDPATHTFGTLQPAWLLTQGKSSPAAPLPDPPDLISH